MSSQGFYWGTLFYVLVGLASRKIAGLVWHRKEDEKMREIFGRYTPSLVHASLSAFWDFVPAAIGGGVEFNNLFANYAGYFLGDMIVDQDPDYYFHHIAPLLWGEALFRSGANLHHSVRCIRIIELGNVFAHTAALLTGRSGLLFHRINTISFWISRPASMPDGFLAWYTDVPIENRWTPFGLVVLASCIVTFYINGKWMIKMIRPREKKIVVVEEYGKKIEEEVIGENGKKKGLRKNGTQKIGVVPKKLVAAGGKK